MKQKCHANSDLTLSLSSSSSSIRSTTRIYAYLSALQSTLARAPPELKQRQHSEHARSTCSPWRKHRNSKQQIWKQQSNLLPGLHDASRAYSFRGEVITNSNERGPSWQAFLTKSFFKAGVFNCLLPDTYISYYVLVPVT